MIRLETLRAAHLRSDRGYRAQLERYARTRQRESSHAAEFHAADRRLRSALREVRAAPHNESPRGTRISGLEQARRRLAESEKAKRMYESTSREMLAEHGEVSRAFKRSEKLQQLVGRACRRRAHAQESQRADLLQEMCVARDARKLVSSRKQPAQRMLEYKAREEGDRREIVAGVDAAGSGTRIPTLIGDPRFSAHSPTPRMAVDGSGGAAVTISLCEEKIPNVTVETSLGSLGSVRVSVSKGAEKGVRVSVDPASGLVAKDLERERSRIVARVASRGIPVSSFEVGLSRTSGHNTYRAKRRGLWSQEGEDDNAIA
jgi:hypothetical protein